MLIAYVVSNDLELNTDEIREYCKKYLRRYMVTSYFIVIDKFPINANGVASFAQQRLWMDEKIRFNESINGQTSVYNELLIYKLTTATSLSIDRLRQALTNIIGKYEIFRTALIYDQDKLMQKILPISNNLFDLEITCVMNDTHLKQIVLNEETNRSLFNLEQGRVFRCHILCQSCNNNDDNN
ncbi:unnamed protein product [Rotaria sp. Silwood1]|nr:unnamed protein product [Rotaria sp. Silwood1]